MPANYSRHCCSCPYNQRCIRGPLSMERGSRNADVLLIFQSPGEEEWKNKTPISSDNPRSAAARIQRSLCRICKKRCDFSITNAVQCYPGKGRNGRDKKPHKTAQRQCANWLKDDISLNEWKKVVVFGSVARDIVQDLGFGNDCRFIFLRHPAGGLSNMCLDRALCGQDPVVC